MTLEQQHQIHNILYKHCHEFIPVQEITYAANEIIKNPTKEIIREFIEKIEIHSDKQVDIYFNFKPLQELNNNLEKFICARKKYEIKTA